MEVCVGLYRSVKIFNNLWRSVDVCGRLWRSDSEVWYENGGILLSHPHNYYST